MNNFNSSNINGGRKAKSLAKFSYEKFIQLAQNSFKIMKYSRTADNCRLAIDLAAQQGNIEGAITAYQLWLKALLKAGKFNELKKVCCEARSKYGNGLDLLYYEFKAAQGNGDDVIGAKLARSFIEMHDSIDDSKSGVFVATFDKITEVKAVLRNAETDSERSAADKYTE